MQFFYGLLFYISFYSFILLLCYPGSSGHAHMMLPLTSSSLYYVSVRAITGAGNALDSASNGITIDTTPPSLTVTEFGDDGDGDFPSDKPSAVRYQKEGESIVGAWIANETLSGITELQVDVGTVPG